MHILIMEDEIKTAAYLQKGLRASGFIVDHVTDGVEGYLLASRNLYDVIILDIMLPKLDGFSIIKKLRHAAITTRILCLTACDALEDKIKGLELGADDYLLKPFAFSELLARTRTLLRRTIASPLQQLHLADLHLDMVKHQVLRGNVRIELTTKEFSLLVFLVTHPGQILSRTLIAESVWDMNFDSDTNVIDVAIKRLRKKIDDPFEKKLIHTLRGRGYFFAEQ